MGSRLIPGTILLALVGVSACRSGVCPTIGCHPQITLSYATPIAGGYQVSVTVAGQRFEATCPVQPSQTQFFVGIQSCDETGLVLSGVDLGHGANDTLTVAIAFDDGPPIQATATLLRITNSRDCDLVCYDHRGAVAN